jgi:hypothetical protein
MPPGHGVDRRKQFRRSLLGEERVMDELENLRAALHYARTTPPSYCEDGPEQAAHDRAEAVGGLQRRIAELESERQGAFNSRYERG